MAMIRYPGSKAKLAGSIINEFPWQMTSPLAASAARWEYREPFFGAGAIGFKVIDELHPKSHVWLNDKDPAIVALWNAVKNSPDKLRKLIAGFRPHEDLFFRFKEMDGACGPNDVEAGFRKLALHQMSISGFGAMSGGPIGGKEQGNPLYKVGCRWNSQRLKLHVTELNRKLNRFDRIQITNLDFADAMSGLGESAFVYLDPPYVEKGGQLYKHNLSLADHERLASVVKSLRCRWALSYDDHPVVRQLYDWARIVEIEVTYTNATHAKGKRPKNREIVILPVSDE